MTAITTSKKTSRSFSQYRAAFALKGESIAAWARKESYTPQYIYDVLRGNRKGPAALKIKSQIEEHLS
jgi:gp16 family phage-associated protein